MAKVRKRSGNAADVEAQRFKWKKLAPYMKGKRMSYGAVLYGLSLRDSRKKKKRFGWTGCDRSTTVRNGKIWNYKILSCVSSLSNFNFRVISLFNFFCFI